MTDFNAELKNQIIEFYRSKKIQMPYDIINNIDDIFNSIKFDENIPDSVNCYSKENVEQLKNDIDVHTYLNVEVNGLSSGNVTRKFTYYGDMRAHYSEEIVLHDSTDNTNTQISKLSGNTTSFDENDWLIIVIEEIKFKEGKSSVCQRLYIYGVDKLSEDRYDEL